MSNVVHPKHYNSHPSGIECMDIVERMGFCAGNAIKYLWRADHKGQAGEDVAKAAFYLDRILQADSHALLGGEGDMVLGNYARRILSHRQWNSAAIWHIINGVVGGNRMEIVAARNILYHFQMHPQERMRAQ